MWPTKYVSENHCELLILLNISPEGWADKCAAFLLP